MASLLFGKIGHSMIDMTDKDFDEIVALLIGSDIYFGQLAIDKAKEKGQVDGIIKRCVFKFMADMDLDPRWEDYANSPTLFTISQYNEHYKLPAGKPIC